MELLSAQQIAEALDALPGWSRDGDALVCELECENFMDAVATLERIAAVAERQGHHPDILLHSYRRLRLTLSTHSEGGITRRDVDLASAIEAL